MSKTKILLGPEDVDAFIDQELSKDRHVALLNAIRRNETLAEHLTDRASLAHALKACKKEIYENDPELSSLIKKLLTGHNGAE